MVNIEVKAKVTRTYAKCEGGEGGWRKGFMGFAKIVKTYFSFVYNLSSRQWSVNRDDWKCASELYSIIIRMYVRNQSSNNHCTL